MKKILALPLALTAIAVVPVLAYAQSRADQAAEAAQLVAARADTAFDRIDPDSEMPRSADASADGDATLTYEGLPPLTASPAPVIDPAPRGPAVRMISSAVVQPLPKPAATPTPAAVSKNNPFMIKSILPVEGTIRYGDWFWDESAAPKAGKLVVTVDLEARVISAFRDGHEIGTAVALLGTQSHPTPLGTFPILTKEKDNISEKYNNAPMPHTLRLTWDGIAIHGSPVMNGYASHGCVAVPDEFAAKLFAAAKRGDKVIITRGKMVSVGDKVL
ncbi:MAG: L,D-transpeptidase [Alphaproteobacteria bacterium HGW-Alphaproteobacteria-16]|nr:MAG: L,D-transpeptidase [Alphaproteobacteria bacterium HGW-Alphaproteobacteria-16]